MSPVHPGVGVNVMGNKAESPSIPTNSQHTPDGNSSAARCLGGEFDSTGRTEAQKNFEKMKSAFQAGGVQCIGSQNTEENFTMEAKVMADIVSSVKAVGGKVVENPSDKTLSIHFANTSESDMNSTSKW